VKSNLCEGAHGPTIQGRPLLNTRAQAEPGIHSGRDTRSGARYRRHHGDFQRGQCGPHPPLPYKEPARLVAISTLYQREGVSRTSATVSLNEVERWRDESRTFESIGSFVFSALPVNVGTQAMFLVAIGADPEFLATLGVQPAMGRHLAGSGSKLKDPSVIISHRLWVEAFHSDPQVLGRSLTMDGAANIVTGVLPASFQFPRSDASYFPEEPDLIFPVANIAYSWGRWRVRRAVGASTQADRASHIRGQETPGNAPGNALDSLRKECYTPREFKSREAGSNCRRTFL
jgi:hypothetical protein